MKKSAKVICTCDAETGEDISGYVLCERIGGRNPGVDIKNAH